MQSSRMCGEQYEQSADFDDSWSCPAVTWSAGGVETYRLDDGRVFTIRQSGAMTIAANARYSYAAALGPFYSNMITFPRFITDRHSETGAVIQTRLIRPDHETDSLMAAIAEHCRMENGSASRDDHWYREKLALLYDRLIATQREIDAAPASIKAIKKKTRTELANRADRAQQFILENFHDPSLNIAKIAREACLSPFHLIRIFKALTDATPMQYLKAARMTAANRLLRDSNMTISSIANHVGYTDRTAFFRAYQNRFKVSPSAQRNATSFVQRAD